MVCCGPVENKEERDRAREIDQFLAKGAKQDASKVKLLLLGAGESGKSTVFKQMRVLYGKPPTSEEKAQYSLVIFANTIDTMKKILSQVEEWDLQHECELSEEQRLVLDLPQHSRMDVTIGTAIKKLWAHEVIQKVWSRRKEFQVVDSMSYFFENIDRLMSPDYEATQQDHLHTRVRTSGVVTTTYDIQGVQFEMYDVGGQRNERRKWIHCFSEVTAVIFVAALSEYDQVLFEDSTTNRMTEALDLFEEICSNPFFEQSSMILFLNKKDLFTLKLQDFPIEAQWPDYTGGSSPENGWNYFKDKFLERNKNPKRHVYYHITQATDTSNIGFVFQACKDIILERNIDDSGF